MTIPLRSNEVSSEQVAAYKEMCVAHAWRFSRLPDMVSHYDDFVQEGLIAVWEALKEGHKPSNLAVTNAMRDYAKKERHRGFTGYDPVGDELELVSLETLEASG